MIKPNNNDSSFGGCSRRVFLEKALAGAAVVATTHAIDRPICAAMLNAAPASVLGELADLDLHEAAALVRQKKVSPLQLTHACLARIEALDSRLNSFITVTAESALAEARQAEAELARGMWRGPLHGIPVALKDLIDTAGVRTTAGSALFKDRIPREDAVVVQRLRESGAVFLGKLNMYEVAFTLPESSGRTVIQAEAYSYHAASMAATPERYLPETLSKLRLGANIDMSTYIEAKLRLEQVRRAVPNTLLQSVIERVR